MVYNFEKDGSILKLFIQDRPNPVLIDCRDMSITSFTGRAVKRLPTLAQEGSTHGIRLLIACLGSVYDFRKVEPFLASIERIPSYWEIPDECPKGFLKFIEQNDLPLSNASLGNFRLAQATKNLSPQYLKNIQFFKENFQRYVHYLEDFKDVQYIAFAKILNNSLKKFYINFERSMNAFMGQIAFYGNAWTEIADTNRDVPYNVQLLADNADAFSNRRLAEQLVRLAPLEEATLADEFSDYVIKVPRNIADLREEGSQQHNCVGHFYNDSIMAGRNLIYFIRHKNNPDKSYITCRYSLDSRGTVEYRLVNNRPVTDAIDLALIKAISHKIPEILFARGE